MTQDADECPVCLDEFPKRPLVLDCGHRFHRRCASAWFARSSITCPTCRALALGWLTGSRARLSTRARMFVDTVDRADEARAEPDFWPAWFLAELGKRGADAFADPDDVRFLREVAFQSFDRVNFFALLRRLEA